MFFFTMLCSGQVHKGNALVHFKTSGKNFQKTDKISQSSFDLYNLSDDDHDESLLDEVEKVKLDLDHVVENWISILYNTFYTSDKPVVAHHHPYIDIPKYILYHSLQIAYC
ncbi:hypothetical protein [Elizabethkingia occulta]|uniref:hypothetical protein n=1 Tax=Elizabethkingia occulta TaxID=1867263 RepID=UPI00105465C4